MTVVISIFQTPQDVSGTICEGAVVSFTPDDSGQRAAGVELIEGCGCVPPCGGV